MFAQKLHKYSITFLSDRLCNYFFKEEFLHMKSRIIMTLSNSYYIKEKRENSVGVAVGSKTIIQDGEIHEGFNQPLIFKKINPLC